MKKHIIALSTLLMVFIAILGIFIGPDVVDANPSQLMVATTAPATSTLAYLTPGTGTTTLTFDAGEGAMNAADSAVLLLQYTASGTSPVLNAAVEYSQDKINWYPASTVISTATTTVLTGSFSNFQWAISTSTLTIAGSGTESRVHQSAYLGTIPTRYARVKFYVPASGGNGGLWAQIVAKKQIR